MMSLYVSLLPYFFSGWISPLYVSSEEKKKKEAALSVYLEKLNIGLGDIELVVINLLSGTKFHLTLQEHFICIILLV